ncbi:MAG: helix-turn-helix domain-containing protein [Oligoflexales bacterium]|nr:helix-turn-helix domain-containing protein [Oligoflexales bacterium]
MKRKTREELRTEFYKSVDEGTVTPREAVKRFRRMLGLSQRDFASKFKVSARILMAFEQGRGNPTLATLQKMLTSSGLELRVGRKSIM